MDLHVLGYQENGHLTVRKIRPWLTQVQRHPISRASLLAHTLFPRPRCFARFGTPNARAEFKKLLLTYKPDIVHFDSIGSLALVDEIQKNGLPVKIVAHLHDCVSELYFRLSSSGSWWKKIFYKIEARKLRSYESCISKITDVTVVDSKEDAEILRNLDSYNNVKVIPLGVDVEIFTADGPCAPLVTPSIVMTGSMASMQSEEAAEFLIKEIMPKVWVQNPQAAIYLVGSNPTKRIQLLAGDRVVVTGYVENLAAYMRAATVYVCPLRLGSGMRTRVVEALGCGVPMVATPMSTRGLAHRDTKEPPWIEANTSTEFAVNIVRLLNDESYRRSISKDAEEYVKSKYSWDAIVTSIVAEYSCLIQSD